MDKKKEHIIALEQLVHMYLQMMIEHQTNIRHHQGRLEIEKSIYKTAKAHYEEYSKQLKELKRE